MTTDTVGVWSECETWSPERIADFQLKALRQQLRYVYDHSDFYRTRWDEMGWKPADLQELDDLRELPPVTKRDYVESLERSPPWGDALAADPRTVVRVHFSSGTTSRPTPVCWTGADLDRWTDLYARMAYSQGVRDTDIYQCLFSYPWFVGGLGATTAYTRIGATVIPGGSGDTRRQIETIFGYGTTAVGGTPSFMVHLGEVAEEVGTPLHDSMVRRVMTGGEPGAAIAGTRGLIERLWGAKAYDGYGSLEFQPIAWECAEQCGGHLAEDFVYAEVIDADTAEPVPDGTPGVLVLSHLDKQATPLVRWWTGDVVVRDGRMCACGRSHARLVGGVHGRADDMLVVRGVNVFPSAVEDTVRRTAGTTGEYRIVLDADVLDRTTGYPNAIKVQVEAQPTAEQGLADRLATSIRAEHTIRALVEVVAPGTLPRQAHKSQRVVRDL